MDIVVLVKAVPDSEAKITLKAGGSGLQMEEKWELNYFDELAVEAAVRMKEAGAARSVTAVSYGPKRALEAARKAAAMGADGAVLIDGPEELLPDSLAVARVLAACVRSVPFDLVWCGRRATDDGSAQVGPMVAELLQIPHVSAVVQVEPVDGGLRVTREREGGHDELLCPLPALLTAQKGLNEPRVPTIQGVMKGMRLTPKRMTLEGLGFPATGPTPGGWRICAVGETAQRRAVRFIEGADAAAKARELVRLLREEARVI